MVLVPPCQRSHKLENEAVNHTTLTFEVTNCISHVRACDFKVFLQGVIHSVRLPYVKISQVHKKDKSMVYYGSRCRCRPECKNTLSLKLDVSHVSKMLSISMKMSSHSVQLASIGHALISFGALSTSTPSWTDAPLSLNHK